ncbi:DUF1284 domain-containing protein [Paenibacillus chartarius]|uniref:DUF1284 domain-containing protein n=1 Tax=Paenibacillus chartarius TaxID=747481 RepID=A0ABV6DFQ9_9BACL
MERTVKLRGHHLLCMLGYRGMGYSPAYAENMSAVHERLRAKPGTEIELVAGPDDLCVCFPADKPYHCDADSVHRKDALVLAHLGFKLGETMPWAEVLRRVAERVRPEHIPQWCATCPWLSYGVCEEGVRIVKDGGGLRELPEA